MGSGLTHATNEPAERNNLTALAAVQRHSYALMVPENIRSLVTNLL